MSNLVPEKRLDKNGRLVTKHVKASPGPSSTRSIPSTEGTTARALKAFDAIRNHRSVISFYLVNEIQRALESNSVSHAAMERLVLTLHPETLGRLDKLNQRSPINGVRKDVIASIKERSFVRLNNYAVLRDPSDGLYESEASMLIGGLNMHRDKKNYLDYSDATEEELAAPRAVIRAAMTLIPQHVTTDAVSAVTKKYIFYPLLADLINERPEDVDLIVSFVNERKPAVITEEWVEEMVEILDSGAHEALLNGTL